eukprot:68504-Prorocentrum_minimum.AAC.2
MPLGPSVVLTRSAIAIAPTKEACCECNTNVIFESTYVIASTGLYTRISLPDNLCACGFRHGSVAIGRLMQQPKHGKCN